MAEFTIYHNPKCSKSRETVSILKGRAVDLQIIEYLKTPLSSKTLAGLLAKLPDGAKVLLRKDNRFRELGYNAEDYTTADSVAEILEEHPELMQRPVVVRGSRAVIARPADRVLEILN